MPYARGGKEYIPAHACHSPFKKAFAQPFLRNQVLLVSNKTCVAFRLKKRGGEAWRNCLEALRIWKSALLGSIWGLPWILGPAYFFCVSSFSSGLI